MENSLTICDPFHSNLTLPRHIRAGDALSKDIVSGARTHSETKTNGCDSFFVAKSGFKTRRDPRVCLRFQFVLRLKKIAERLQEEEGAERQFKRKKELPGQSLVFLSAKHSGTLISVLPPFS